MHKCQVCSYSTDWSSNLRKHERAKHIEYVFNKNYIKNTVFSNNSRSHVNGIHNEGELNQNYNNTLYSMNQDVYDIRLKENFKLFISGPSRCGKTTSVWYCQKSPINYTQTDTKPIIHTDVNIQPINYTQTDAKPIIQPINSTQTDTILDSTKYTNFNQEHQYDIN